MYSTGNSAPSYMATWIGGEFGGERIYVYVRLCPLAVHLKPSQRSVQSLSHVQLFVTP